MLNFLTNTTGAAGMASPLIMMILMIAIFYFMLIRPENKRKKEAEQMRSAVKTGDKITTIGGICGRIVAVKDEIDSIVIETGSDRSKMLVKRWAIGSVDTVHEDDQA